jgi:DNA polymerase-1
MEKLIVIDTREMFLALKDYIEDKEFISYDVETNGVEKDSKIIGFSICAEQDKSFYVILKSYDVSTKLLTSLNTDQPDLIKSFLIELTKKKLIMHNAVFDCDMTNRNCGIDLMPSVHTDTMILAHLLDENRPKGLKELGTLLLGSDATKEKEEMIESIKKNEGSVSKVNYELYKADSNLIAKYGAKDALLTFNLFELLIEDLYTQGLEKFFYEEESMPLLKGTTYQLNTVGIRVDSERMLNLKRELETENLELRGFIQKEIQRHVQDKYPGTNKKNTFNIQSNQQLAWLLFVKLGNQIGKLTEAGKKLCKKIGVKVPYSPKERREFIEACALHGDSVGPYYKYVSVDSDFLQTLSDRHKWVAALLKLNKNSKILSTYIEGIQEKAVYNIIYPSFLQSGTTSGRYSSKNPNFQNLPRDDKRIKECIVSRPGKVFVGADYSQLEPRVFASVSQDPTLMACFAKGEDFYSVVGAPIFGIKGTSMIKDDPDSFATKHKKERQIAKAFALATPYGTTAFRQAQALKMPREECQSIIDGYFNAYPMVEAMMIDSHKMAIADGQVKSLYGRPRRIPEAKLIPSRYGKNTSHEELPYEARTLLNLSMNHRVQSSAASIVNRASIALIDAFKATGIDAKIVLQVHDQIVVECKEEDAEDVCMLVKHCMEKTTILPGVRLVADPSISKNLAGQK